MHEGYSKVFVALDGTEQQDIPLRRGVTAVDELVQERGPIIVSEDGHINVRLMCAGVCERMRGLQVCKFASLIIPDS